ncbi:amidohydrolase [Hoeflea marina]|uniref:Amidohydrolase n=1 Tax=Hoeflea marina TaxID=274592 RepID=A0A317PJX8_9HYPH|nr:amidohydrolase [Hoeflea marina]PWW00594.1 amidohydrolase [Hoeflea marina]
MDTEGLTRLRHALHRMPEISGAEAETAGRIAVVLAGFGPDRIIAGLGGHGVAAVFDSGVEGPTVLFRSELDGLPIAELPGVAWRSEIEGRAHLCGHDGHMAILCGLGARMAARRPARGRVVLMFQPAEETGAGAAAVIADPGFAAIVPDYAFALHNLPGLPLGHVGVRAGAFNFASEGLAIRLTGKTAHASQPEAGISPAAVMCQLVTALPLLPARLGIAPEDALVTLVHARLGEAAFGIAPGEADVWATIRSISDPIQARLLSEAEALARSLAEAAGLAVECRLSDGFAACHNDAEASALVEAAVEAEGLPRAEVGLPFRWSEDFGRFGSASKAALFVLGAGEGYPRLHNPDYDFPDALIPLGVRMFERVARALCG